MKFSLLKKAIAASLLFGMLAPQTQAQWKPGGLPNFIKRWEIGYTYSIASATYKSTESITTPDGSKTFEKSIEQNVRSKFSFGALMGTYIPLKKIGGKSLLAIGINAQYNAYLWDYSVPTFQGFKTDVNNNIIDAYYSAELNPGISAMTIQAGLPISLDVKWGGEASLQRGEKYTGTLGIGAYPSGSMTADYGNGGFGFGVTPFAKAEIGAKAGIFWKLRVQYLMGNIPFYTEGNSINKVIGIDAVSKSELIGKGVISASLVLMPFSWNFQEDGWWNWHH
jgi:hypothetical protein